MTTDEKVEKIFETEKLCQVLPEWRPEPHNEEYYFVSYAHEDYKAVYKDIFAFQNKAINIWYDAGMPPTQSWKEIAEMFIRKYACKGVIFYISEHSILSKAIHEEMEYVRKCGKEFVVINLPIVSDYKFQGINWKGRTDYSALKLLNILKSNNIKGIRDKKYNLVSELLNEDVRYIEYGTLIENKINELKKLSQPNLFEFGTNFSGDLVVNAINDIDVRELREKDFIYSDKNCQLQCTVEIGSCALANCRSLEKVNAPNSLLRIGEFAFYGCRNLFSIEFPNVNFIDTEAFTWCNKLEKISLKHVVSIGDRAFMFCNNISELDLPRLKVIGQEAFAWCNKIKVLNLKNISQIGRQAFEWCDGIERLYLPEVQDIGDLAFDGCGSLRYIEISKIKTIGMMAFDGCASLDIIKFNGTKKDWYAIKKGKDWDLNTHNYTIYCLDGMIKKSD